jgi:starvation-inducible DNA-binding protein
MEHIETTHVSAKYHDIRLNFIQMRKRIVNLLSNLLVNTYILSLKTFNYHWNIQGRLFDLLHETAEEQYDDFMNAVNEIAERIRELGYEIPDTYSHVGKLSEMGNEDFDISSILADLVRRNDAIVNQVRTEIVYVAEAKDDKTYNLLMKRLKKHEENSKRFKSIV